MADEQAKPTGPIDRLVAWVTGQEFNNALLVLILAAICYGVYYAMNTAIPAHLKTIQDGYDRITVQASEERRAIETNHTTQVERIVGGYEKAIDRDRALMEHILGSESPVNSKKVGALK